MIIDISHALYLPARDRVILIQALFSMSQFPCIRAHSESLPCPWVKLSFEQWSDLGVGELLTSAASVTIYLQERIF